MFPVLCKCIPFIFCDSLVKLLKLQRVYHCSGFALGPYLMWTLHTRIDMDSSGQIIWNQSRTLKAPDSITLIGAKIESTTGGIK